MFRANASKSQCLFEHYFEPEFTFVFVNQFLKEAKDENFRILRSIKRVFFLLAVLNDEDVHIFIKPIQGHCVNCGRAAALKNADKFTESTSDSVKERIFPLLLQSLIKLSH